jgi:hypothetical protein
MTNSVGRARDRTVLMVATPALWPAWPFLPLVRRTSGKEELGVVFDARHTCGLIGFSSTVWHCNLFALPSTLGEFFALPHDTFDSAEELAASGWQVD